MSYDVAIIGAGLAGLTCARRLQDTGRSCVVLEATDAVGGRVRTDCVEGYQLDRGFQVLLTAYPEAQRWLDYAALDLREFTPGALVRLPEGGQARVSDPFRRPGETWATLRAPVGTWADKARIATLRWKASRGSLADLLKRPETSTLAALRAHGFSERMIERFLRPWLSGIFLEGELATSSRMLEFVFRMFAAGVTAVPARGMRAIPEQLAAGLAAGTLRFNAPVGVLGAGGLRLETGEHIAAQQIVVATDGATAARLVVGVTPPKWRATVTLYFAAKHSPVGEGTLVLNGTGAGRINTLVVMSDVAPSYAPAGEVLIAISVIGDTRDDDETLTDNVRAELNGWYGAAEVATWRCLKIYRVHHALPVRQPLVRMPARALRDGVWVCGDHRDTASIQGAMQSGRETADAIILPA
jgi:phytoene dehydrogenase-like protein